MNGDGQSGFVKASDAGCVNEDILTAVGLKLADLYPDSTKAKLTIVETYRYRDEAGQHLYDVLRFEPKDFRQRRAACPDCV